MDRGKLVSQINQIFKFHQGVNIEKFKITFDPEFHAVTEDIDDWIELAAKKSVRTFVLKFNWFSVRSYNIPSRFLTCLSFECLRILRFDQIGLNDEVLDFFLSKSPNLDSLWLRGVLGISKLVLPSSFLKLRFLLLVQCQDLREIEICARNLEEFIYVGPPTTIVVKDVSSLHTFCGRGCHATLSEEITYLRQSIPLFQLEKLTLNLSIMESYVLDQIQEFGLPRLKELFMQIVPCEGDEILNCLHLLEGAPILHSLTIEFTWHFRSPRIGSQVFDARRMCPIQSLKVVKILQFRGLPKSDGLLVKTLLENYVKSLEKLTVASFHMDWPTPYHIDFLSLFHIDFPIPNASAINKEVEDNIALLFEKGIFPTGTVIDSRKPHNS